jgi:menaquinone-9 beta-reductase
LGRKIARTDEREVIIVGAGPAGAIAAVILAQYGHDVLLLDKHDFPRNKTCGDAVSSKVIEIMHSWGMKAKVEAAISRGEFYPLKSLRLVSPKGYQLTSELQKSTNSFYPYTVPRLFLDALIQKHAVEAGAEFQKLKVEELLIKNGRATGVRAGRDGFDKKIYAKITVGADGVNSAVARALRGRARHTDSNRALAIRAYIEDIEINRNQVEFYLYRNILPGYAWIFPTGENCANIGLGMRLDHYHKTERTLRTMFEDFLNMPDIKNRLKEGGRLRDIATWPLNFGSQKNLKYAFNGALLIGDAAGFVNPLTGGGIHSSLISGQLAAGVIHEALLRDEFRAESLREYEIQCARQILSGLGRAHSVQKLLFRFPYLADLAAGNLRGNSMLTRALAGKL